MIAIAAFLFLASAIAAVDPADRAKALVDQMTIDEKVGLLHGDFVDTINGYTGVVPGIPRLDIPSIVSNDGPQGFRGPEGTSTAWPSGLAVAASWDVSAMQRWGEALGKEFHDKGANVFLGPGLNVARVPLNGRNFEYISGEDPYLGNQLAQAIVTGVQSQKVVATAKHFINNNQETNRFEVSENVDERTRFEIYYPPFEGAIHANVGAIMCSYNRVNGRWSCENNATLTTDLKIRLNPYDKYFWVMSDWFLATRSPSLNEGLDQEMPGGIFMPHIKAMIDKGQVTTATLDKAIVNMLTPLIRLGIFDDNNTGTRDTNVTSPEHTQLARELSANSTVLLQNRNNILPLNATGLKTIAVIGEQAGPDSIYRGGGSGQVVPSYVMYPLAGIKAALGFENPFNTEPLDCTPTVCVGYADGKSASQTVSVATAAEVALVFAGTTSSEGVDRKSLSYSPETEETISIALANSNKSVIVLTTPGAILTPWSADVDAILVNFLPGEQAGNAVADVIFGHVNPSGKLPLTFPNIENEVGFTERQYPGLNNAKEAYYDEKLLVGYRWYDYHNIEPKFPFGHGLSYTTFNYSSLSIDGRNVAFTVTNVGKVFGSEVAQLYLTFPVRADEPPQQLKAFTKFHLQPGASGTLSTYLPDRDLSIWNVDSHAWQVVNGTFGVAVGSSSRDIRLRGTISN